MILAIAVVAAGILLQENVKMTLDTPSHTNEEEEPVPVPNCNVLTALATGVKALLVPVPR
jgi:hypothetical protein